MRHYLSLLFTGLLLLMPSLPRAQALHSLSEDEKKYLFTLAEDTYRYLDFFRDVKTGLPYDNSRHNQQPYTSVTNVGLQLANLVGAVEMGFEARESAVQKARQILNSMSLVRTWHGFPLCWMYTDYNKKHSDPFVSSVDLGNYFAGIITARQYFPELQKECDELLGSADWNKLYHAEKKLLYGGYDADKNQYTEWLYTYLGSESRLASALAVAMSGVPAETWTAFDRTLEKRYGVEYLKPGWQGGGLFLGYLAGVFLDERGTVCAISAGNFVKAQMLHKERIGAPAWGWSASDSPQDGYLGINAIRDHVITPHASALAIGHYPHEVIQNLKKLEELGVRPITTLDGKRYSFGFRDALDTKTNRITSHYLMLDQSMIFLSLVNFLKDRPVNRAFQSYPPVQKALAKIPDYASKITAEQTGFPVSLSPLTGTKVVALDVERPSYKIHRAQLSPLFNPQEWTTAEVMPFSNELIEKGKIDSQMDFYATVAALWDKDSLFIQANVKDQTVRNKMKEAEIYKEDLIEIYVNPDGQGLLWGNTKDFQIGITPPAQDGTYHSYSWFQRRRPSEQDVKVISVRTEDGYTVTAAISWKFLKLYGPTEGQTFGLSIGINDLDDDSPENTKLNWFFRTEEGKIVLGRAILQ